MDERQRLARLDLRAQLDEGREADGAVDCFSFAQPKVPIAGRTSAPFAACCKNFLRSMRNLASFIFLRQRASRLMLGVAPDRYYRAEEGHGTPSMT